jgi:HlyD family secretion protein
VPARVVRIAADSAPDPGTGRLLYEVDLEILRAPDKEGPVPIAGAPAEVYIPLDARTPLALLLDPLTAYFARAFRS